MPIAIDEHNKHLPWGDQYRAKLDSVPGELKASPHWVTWKYVEKATGDGEKRLTKVPHRADYRTPASSTAPSHWCDFKTIRGVGMPAGFVFGKGDGLVGIDLDNVRNPETGEIDKKARGVIEAINSYAEISPSGTGVKIYCLAKPQLGGKTGAKRPFNKALDQDIEMYWRGRYFCVTGEVIEGFEALRDASEAVEDIWGEYFSSVSDSEYYADNDWRPFEDKSQDELDALYNAALKPLPDSIEGSGGSNAFFRAVCEVVRSPVSEHDGRYLIDRFNNEKCFPPWGDEEVEHKIQQALERNPTAVHADDFDVVEPDGEATADVEEPTVGKRLGVEGKRFRIGGATELADIPKGPGWLVQGVMKASHPFMFCGPEKSLKSLAMFDMLVSLSQENGRYLNHFKVNRRCRTLFMCGEGGLETIQDYAKTACRGKGVTLDGLEGWFFWSDDLPQFGKAIDAAAIGAIIEELEIDVLAIDPAYLCSDGQDAGNLHKFGDSIRPIHDACRKRGVTFVLAHHTSKLGHFKPIELSDSSWAGYRQFFGQWCLVNRREKYEPGTGSHKLWHSYGSRAGSSSVWAVDIDEGSRMELTFDDNGESEVTTPERQWRVDVMTAAEANAGDATTRKTEDAAAVRLALVEAGKDGLTQTRLQKNSGVKLPRVKDAIEEMTAGGEVEACEVLDYGGGRYKTPRKHPGYRLVGGLAGMGAEGAKAGREAH